MTIDLKDGERIDDLQRNGYKIIQNGNKFCFGMDAVLLSGFADAMEGEKVLDIGTGTGIIPILMEAKTDGAHFTGLEIQEASAEMAERSVRLNGLEDKIEIVCGDINNTSNLWKTGDFDVITTNPPYMINSHGLKSDNMEKSIARHEICCTLEDIVRESSRLLKIKGRFYMVHRPFRLVGIFTTLAKYRLEPKRMRLVYPFADKEPNMVLIEALKDGNPRLTVEKPLIVYKEPGVYTDEIYEIYGYDK
ncbi:MAG: tRNA1(Val) (adenine(37)-N6)-methyltransferase [Lachnospiraceae bacterium]|nr:tRNA1(Val) (adenine(37)-N6)-methyltransferase [Lachnospiraceae bacterium]